MDAMLRGSQRSLQTAIKCSARFASRSPSRWSRIRRVDAELSLSERWGCPCHEVLQLGVECCDLVFKSLEAFGKRSQCHLRFGRFADASHIDSQSRALAGLSSPVVALICYSQPRRNRMPSCKPSTNSGGSLPARRAMYRVLEFCRNE